ncbi:signal peptidase I [Candidatus Woesebacteria bacterium]|nr:signal peptidase I [Candidatus Woesebacteria bacterium]
MFAIWNFISSFVVDLIETAVIGISIFLVIYLFFVQPHQVSGQSMDPFLKDKDYVLTDKISYKTHPPARGDIVVFHAPDSANCPVGAGCDYIKRVIAVPGETVEIREDGFYINGKHLVESYLGTEVQTLPGAFTKNKVITLGAHEYFVSGDNRMHSSDSRAWGPIQPEMIVGRAFFRYWPVRSLGKLQAVSYAASDF